MLPLIVVDALPGGLAFEHVAGTVPGAWLCGLLGSAITCTDTTATLAVGGTSVITVLVRVTAPAGTHIRNVATVSGPGDGGAPAEVGSVDAIVSAGVPDPGTGAGLLLVLSPGLLLIVAGAGSVFVGRRRRRRSR